MSLASGRFGHCQTEEESQRPQRWSSLVRVVSNEVLALLNHESAAHIIKIDRCGLEVFYPPRCFHAMTRRLMVWHFVVHKMIDHASELLYSSKCHFVKRENIACFFTIHWTHWSGMINRAPRCIRTMLDERWRTQHCEGAGLGFIERSKPTDELTLICRLLKDHWESSIHSRALVLDNCLSRGACTRLH